VRRDGNAADRLATPDASGATVVPNPTSEPGVCVAPRSAPARRPTTSRGECP